ncbi:MAG: hypothetical protein JWQ27_1188 [Ferruginibacter sp.]|nr:hypothetical protein [Ferruginibacter sp.]
MAKYTIRIELREAEPNDYTLLEAGMLTEGFRSTIGSTDGGIFKLPFGTYNMETPAGIDEVYKLAEKVANSTEKGNWVIISEAINRRWKLQEIFE